MSTVAPGAVDSRGQAALPREQLAVAREQLAVAREQLALAPGQLALARGHAGRGARRGLTLLEVMVAVAILAFGLTAILTAQTGLFSSSQHSGKLSLAVGLARCKMSEIEEKLLRTGFSLTGEDEQGPCCEDEEGDFTCEWSVAPVELPELSLSGGGADAGVSASGAEGGEASGGSDPLSQLSSAKDSFMGGNASEAMSGLGGMLGGGAGPSAGAGALAPIAMGMIYPQLKAMLEASIRKVRVRVRWREGSQDRDLSVVQYITNPQQGGFAAGPDEALLTGAGGAGGQGVNGAGVGRGAAGSTGSAASSRGLR